MKGIFVYLILSLFWVYPFQVILSADGMKKSYDIRAFGAIGDGVTDNTLSINQAVEACSRDNGGTVIVPEGIYQTGSIILKSHVNILIKKGAVLRGIHDLGAYASITSYNKEDKYYMIKSLDWNKALLIGDGICDVRISGEGALDGGHLEDEKGEEGMRGPHVLFFSRSTDISVSGIQIRRASNYAIMGYDIGNLSCENLLIEEGWDGIHLRGGHNLTIMNCRFFTGDDAIAGGLWENVRIEGCELNSSCNGIRVIMPVSGMKVSDCRFQGPGKYPHRTSHELSRKNMLSGILIQPGAWFTAPGIIEDVVVTDCSFDNLGNPFLFTLNEGNRADRIHMERITGRRLSYAAASIESWSDSSFQNICLSDISLEYIGGNEKGRRDTIPEKPATDCRLLPCWGLYLRKVNRVTLRNIHLSYPAKAGCPALRFDDVSAVRIEKVEF